MTDAPQTCPELYQAIQSETDENRKAELTAEYETRCGPLNPPADDPDGSGNHVPTPPKKPK